MKKVLSGGTEPQKTKSPDKKGAFITVQKTALGKMKCGGRTKKK